MGVRVRDCVTVGVIGGSVGEVETPGEGDGSVTALVVQPTRTHIFTNRHNNTIIPATRFIIEPIRSPHDTLDKRQSAKAWSIL